MAIIKHIEYKIICDNCKSDVTSWSPSRNKKEALAIAKKNYGKPFVNGKQFCEECEDIETRKPAPKPITGKEFKNAKKINMIDEIIKNQKAIRGY